MDKVLIVDGDTHFLKTLKSGLEKVRQFEILTAETGEAAIAILGREKIAVFVTDVEIPDIESLDLLAHMTNYCPNTPCIIMTNWGKPWFGKRLAQQSFLYHLEKPFPTAALVSAIFVGLTLRDEGSHFKGMTMMSLLPLMELYQKTCRLKVNGKGRENGYLYFKDGDLLDAHYLDLKGETAAREIATWKKIAIELSDLPYNRTKKRIKTKLMDMAGFSWTKHGVKLETLHSNGMPQPNQVSEAPAAPENENLENSNDSSNVPINGLPENNQQELPEVKSAPGGTKATGSVYQSIIGKIRKTIPCKGVAITDQDAKILAAHQKDKEVKIPLLAVEMTGLFKNAMNSTREFEGLSPGALTFHANDATILIQKITRAHHGELFIIMVCHPGTNAHLARNQLAELFAGPAAKKNGRHEPLPQPNVPAPG